MERRATTLRGNCWQRSCPYGPSSFTQTNAPSGSPPSAPRSSSETCTTSRPCVARCGVTRAYFVYPLAEGLLEAVTTFAAAAEEAKVEFIVNMSQITARADFPSEAARRYWLGERIFDWSVLGRSIEYVDIPVAPWAQALAPFRTPYVIEYLSRVSEAHQRGELDIQNDIVRQIGGAPARPPEAFIAENRAAFGG